MEADGSVRERISAWCQGRSWAWRATLLGLLAWMDLHQLRDAEAGSLFSGLTLAVHEAGHLIFGWFGEFLGVAGGSILQVAAPVLAGIVLLRQGDWFGPAVTGTWLSSSLVELSRYIGDARTQEMQLVGFSDDPEHDWAYLLNQFGRLNQDTRYAAIVHALGGAVLLGSVVYGAWLCWRIAGAGGAATDS